MKMIFIYEKNRSTPTLQTIRKQNLQLRCLVSSKNIYLSTKFSLSVAHLDFVISTNCLEMIDLPDFEHTAAAINTIFTGYANF